ncbi:MAG: methyl-accepting chemotaxis protein [Tepidiphilus sp.]|jgi:twitching motility protein PilJ|nr:methyl-accepting chemotaxis protein [Tepidiphilus sp.]MDD3432558.1 methyl-accepting chemotaxis protein [Tepidiphilus sp.]
MAFSLFKSQAPAGSASDEHTDAPPRLSPDALRRRLILLASVLIVMVAAIGWLVVSVNQAGLAVEERIAAIERVKDAAHALGRTLPWTLRGEAEAFTALRQNRRTLDESLSVLVTKAAKHPQTAELQTRWRLIQPLLQRFLDAEPSLRAFRESAPEAQELTESAFKLLGEIDRLIADANELRDAVQIAGETAISTRYLFIMLAAIVIVGVFVALSKTYLDDARARELETERQRQRLEEENARTQQAIMQLLNEISDLADGDLTIRATVSEDVTGAIADSVNYAIEELGSLVRRINDTAERITDSTEEARRISGELLEAAQTQADKIEEADAIVQDVANALRETAASAEEAAGTAGRSLDASAKGTEAVNETIQGMNRIRDQIQETAKRIKRLGESSQEIGEIVELISDITDQTNVLALNAAIQAAAAGEAGRGFTVVAEEVQRLAERSAEATKQIAAIVKTIQTDTQDAVGSMEAATREVVAGTALSDSAGAALEEISRAATETATRITRIAHDIQAQAERGAQVSALMREILAITQQTREGTERTVQSIESLGELAADLRGSVAGFRV